MPLIFKTDSTCTYLETSKKSMTKKIIPNTLKTTISICVKRALIGITRYLGIGSLIQTFFLKLIVNFFIIFCLFHKKVHHIIFLIIIPHVNFPYKTSIDERLIFYNITRCYSDGEHCHSFAIAAGDIVKYQSFV